MPWIFSAWIGLCILLFSPARYLLFLLFLASSYPLQSFGALLSTLILGLYVPIIYAVLVFIGVGLPLLVIYPFVKNGFSPFRGILASVILPIACSIASIIFYAVLPLAGMSVGWLKAKDVLKATNGPAAIVFNYFTAPFAPLALPVFFEQTPKKNVDLIRCHVAAVYLNDRKLSYFVKNQYPDIYNKLTVDQK